MQEFDYSNETSNDLYDAVDGLSYEEAVFAKEDIEKIKEIVIDDYHFSEDDSNDDHWVFIKNEKMKYIKK